MMLLLKVHITPHTLIQDHTFSQQSGEGLDEKFHDNTMGQFYNRTSYCPFFHCFCARLC
uniref:Fatty acid amide hydrolase-like n=1 Tax=Rhizophora mucronata TaxID=61149 RepID=A0A2P2MGC6_RHIMU